MIQTNLLTTEAAARAYTESLANQEGCERLACYTAMLLKENQRQNLISKTSEQNLWVRHIADSAQLLEHVDQKGCGDEIPGSWLDLGAGPGLPGLVIAILRPQIPVILVESRAGRVDFLRQCVSVLALRNCDIQGERLERVPHFPAWVISARAFAPLEKLLRLSAPFSTKQTRYLLPKGRSAAHELSGLQSSIRSMFHVKPSLTDADAGIIVSK
ncbi:MAG: 16S rRNA (guanine(527)-N(7))-methyltransferase RsmG [Pseudomonadota bacterium]